MSKLAYIFKFIKFLYNFEIYIIKLWRFIRDKIMEYSVLPLRNTVLFPNQIIPIYIGRQQSLKLIKDVHIQEDKIF